MEIFTGGDNSTESYQRPECPGANSPSTIVDLEEAKRDALLLQIQKLRSAELARTNSMLQRLGLSSQQDPLPSPQPPDAPRCRPASQLHRRRMRPASLICPSSLTTEDIEEICTPTPPPPPSALLPKRRANRLPVMTTKFGGMNKEVAGGYRLLTAQHHMEVIREKIKDVHIPCELKSISLSCTPTPPPPPSAPLPKRRANRLPVMTMKLGGMDKEVADGYRLLTAQHHMEVIRKKVNNLQGNSVALLSRPPPAPATRKPVERKPVERKPVERKAVVAPFAPAPPPKPSLPKKRATHGRSVRPAKTVSRDQRTDVTSRIQTAKSQNQEDLQPLSNPAGSLSLCFKQLDSDDWEVKVKGLQCIPALAKHHPDTLMLKLHEVCLAVIEEVKNLRSSVACAAIDTIRSLYVHLQRDMDTEAQTTGRALLLKIAQASGNAFVQQQANEALEALVQNCSPSRVLPALLDAGLSHLSPAVRASTALQLHLLADRLGADKVLTAGQSFTQRFLIAVSKASLDAAAEVRPHGHAILQDLALHRDFTKLWEKHVQEKDRRSLEKLLKKAVKK